MIIFLNITKDEKIFYFLMNFLNCVFIIKSEPSFINLFFSLNSEKTKLNLEMIEHFLLKKHS